MSIFAFSENFFAASILSPIDCCHFSLFRNIFYASKNFMAYSDQKIVKNGCRLKMPIVQKGLYCEILAASTEKRQFSMIEKIDLIIGKSFDHFESNNDYFYKPK